MTGVSIGMTGGELDLGADSFKDSPHDTMLEETSKSRYAKT